MSLWAGSEENRTKDGSDGMAGMAGRSATDGIAGSSGSLKSFRAIEGSVGRYGIEVVNSASPLRLRILRIGPESDRLIEVSPFF